MQNLSVTALSGLALIAAGVIGPSETFARGAETTQVLKSELQGETGREANIVVLEVEPGWETDRHIHPGHVFVYVTEGTSRWTSRAKT